MLTIDKLNAFGADTQTGLGRCMNNEAFYFRLIGMALKDANFEGLKAALEAGDLDAAFEASHALKGVLANLSLDPILKPASEMCELLRSRTQMDYRPMLEELFQRKAELEAMQAE
ncbi:MAG: Hpt domain-containing protein [Firmicutes bacterium]|jgi:HPt (histidine-containing phosphotransfer) domain-containing protein|nr:Hpt domain-containing protein [Bacillota bacterium]MBQ6295804.1 Hpt domain-containing protein [Bacillota bacterium]MBR0051330.1 Hpt domain-containing protein [Bacillota bacterium]MBR0517461.1 Hpt domain-containing protein [Bacillota bacterium]MBR2098259.1 Hpt domain-containing protein [Bacillota bacterium]